MVSIDAQGSDSAGRPGRDVTAKAGEIPLATQTVQKALIVATTIVLGLGVVREIYVARFGHDTFLQDLRHFHLDDELSLPTWYEASLLLLAAGLLALTALQVRQAGGKRAIQWALLAGLFVCLSIDEGASFHESLVGPLRGLLGADGYFYYAWVIPALVGVVALGLYFLPFLLALPRATALGFAISGTIFVGGAVGVEMFEGEVAARLGEQSVEFVRLMLIEEAMEIVGLTMFTVVLLAYLSRYRPRTRVVLID